MNREWMEATDELAQLTVLGAVGRSVKNRPREHEDKHGTECEEHQPRTGEHSAASDAPQ